MGKGKIEYGVYSTVKSQLGGGSPVKNYEAYSQEQPIDYSKVEPLYPVGVILGSGGDGIQRNTGGVEPLLPAGLMSNVAMDEQIRSKLAEACRIEYQGTAELIDILDSKSFTFEKTNFEGIKHLYQATYSINDNGILNVNWITARELADRINVNGASPMLPLTNY